MVDDTSLLTPLLRCAGTAYRVHIAEPNTKTDRLPVAERSGNYEVLKGIVADDRSEG